MSCKCRVRCGGSVRVVSWRLPFAKTRVHCNSNLHAIFGGQKTLAQFFVPVLLFGPARVILRMVHNHSFICRRCYVMLEINRAIK
jgi:hypothetical protein